MEALFGDRSSSLEGGLGDQTSAVQFRQQAAEPFWGQLVLFHELGIRRIVIEIFQYVCRIYSDLTGLTIEIHSNFTRFDAHPCC